MQYMYTVWNKFAHLRTHFERKKYTKNIFDVGDIDVFYGVGVF